MRAGRGADRRDRARMKLWELSAAELAAGYAGAKFSPREALESILGRIEAVNPRLNAIVTRDSEGAHAAADASTARWRAGAPLGAFDGVPLTVKDNIPVRGLRATWGSRIYADFVPEKDELPVRKLRDGGAVILGKTNCSEFTLQGYTDNLVFGVTRNPWDLALTPGGSSGGAVAAVAAGLGPVAVGTDGGGSIRRPAAHTGLVGFKPSRDAVARSDGFPVILLDCEVIGPITRTVADARALFHVLAGTEPRPSSEPPQRRILYVPHSAVRRSTRTSRAASPRPRRILPLPVTSSTKARRRSTSRRSTAPGRSSARSGLRGCCGITPIGWMRFRRRCARWRGMAPRSLPSTTTAPSTSSPSCAKPCLRSFPATI